MTLPEILRAHNFTSGLTEAHIDTLASIASEVSFDENELILVDGERSQNFFLVITGSVTIELRTLAYSVTVQSLGPGQAFGWSSLLDDQDTLFQVRARESTTALRLDGARLKSICQQESALGATILRRTLALVAGRVKATELRFAEMCGVKVAGT